ncbi:hypothetical protein K2173_015185 [Erythroxylum novogranatense]|uniref:BHLH domain-containing protein n=1 Tax=Erythroxylum novogranatense TaxID=1862640 RepID=A0AAV8T2N0_9ROSI|nr:hypothetical protein K2173_015185 [Erythroxylum novogranatense]
MMEMNEKDKLEQEKSKEIAINYHSPGSMSSDWRFTGANIANLSLGLLPTDSQLVVCRGDVARVSSCSSTSMIDSLGPTMWEHPTKSQNLGFTEINVKNNASTSNTIEIGKVGPASLRTCIDGTLDAGWNLPNTMLKGGIFLPTAPLMLSQSLSQFPADSAFIEHAAQFSCFSGGNFGDKLNPFGVPDTMGLYSWGVGMMQGPTEAFTGSGLKFVSGGQAQKNALSVGDAPKGVSMSVDHLAFDDNPVKSQRRSEGFVKSHDELKQGVGKSGSESDEAEFSGDGGQEEPSILDENGGEMFSKSLGSKKRKRNGQDSELDQARQTQRSADVTKANHGTQQKAEHNPISNTSKSIRKQGKTSEPPKEEYIHVRARRGQATNSHSLAERVRREKISERMKFLQDLVPGCSKVTGKAVMLDEIINYVQSLQRQVEFLSMKLATVSPRLDFNVEGLLAKDIFQSRAVSSSALPFSPELPMIYPQLHPTQSGLVPATIPGMESQSDVLRRTVNPQVKPLTGGIKQPSQVPNVWEDDLHNVVQVNYAISAPKVSQVMNGSLPSGQMKIEL